MELALKYLLRVALLCWSCLAQADELPDMLTQLTVMTEDYPPLNYLENGELTGASAEILHLVYTKLGVPFPDIEVLPWSRAYHLLQTDRPGMLFTMSRTSARENLFQWAGPTHASRTFLVTYGDSGIDRYDPATEHDLPVVAVKSDVTQYAMQELGYPETKIELVDSNTTLFHMLLNKREQLFSVADSPFGVIRKTEDFRDFPFVVLATTRNSQGYFAFSQAVDPAVVRAFQQALDSVRDEQLAILSKYGLNY